MRSGTVVGSFKIDVKTIYDAPGTENIKINKKKLQNHLDVVFFNFCSYFAQYYFSACGIDLRLMIIIILLLFYPLGF